MDTTYLLELRLPSGWLNFHTKGQTLGQIPESLTYYNKEKAMWTGRI